jgi:hypothetical protein
MKKLIIIILLFLNINSYGQDTTYYQRHNNLYMSIRQVTDVTNNSVYTQHYNLKKAKQRRNNTIFDIVAGALFVGFTGWLWMK